MSSRVCKIFGYLWGMVRKYFIVDWFDKWDKLYEEENADNSNRDKVRECVTSDCCIEPVDFVEYKDTLNDEEFNINACDSCTLSDSTNTLSEGKGVEFQVNDCLYDYDEEVRVKNGVEGIARRYYGRKGVIKSILFINGKYKLGLKIHDRVNLLYLPEDSVDK